MKVFISWSGPRSRAVASALRDLIPDALQNVETWMSDHEIAAGARWSTELAGALEGSQFGIICLTPENLTAPWLLFEAGSLAKSVANSRVVPYLVDLGPTDVEFPLAQFQGATASRDGTLKLVEGINATFEAPLPTERILRIFDRWWREIEARLAAIPPSGTTSSVHRDERALLEEILELVRRDKAPPPQLTMTDATIPKSQVWRTVHSVTPEEIAALPSTSLRDYLAALKHRWNETGIRGEEDALEGRMSQVQQELRRRGDEPKVEAT